MATIRRLAEDTKRRLRIRAAQNGRSMEDEAREILGGVLDAEPAPGPDPGTIIRQPFANLGGEDLDLPPRPPLGCTRPP